MRALRFERFGSPAVLRIQDTPKPVPGEGEVLVQVKAAGVNPSDYKIVAGYFKSTVLPRTPGRDFAGVVVEGKGHEGDEVWGGAAGFGTVRDGTHAEYVVVPVEALSKKPSSLSMEEAASIGIPFVTAWVSLVRVAQLQPGETLLVVGAGGAVGRAATQIARWKGARVIGAGRSSEPLPGVELVINTTSEDLPSRVQEWTSGTGANVVLDAVGGAMFEPAIRSLGLKGRQVSITSTGEQRVTFNLTDFYHKMARLMGVDSNGISSHELATIADELVPGFESGALSAPEMEIVPFADAISAYEKVASGQARAKQVLRFT